MRAVGSPPLRKLAVPGMFVVLMFNVLGRLCHVPGRVFERAGRQLVAAEALASSFGEAVKSKPARVVWSLNWTLRSRQFGRVGFPS
jgi:hypothetical protein